MLKFLVLAVGLASASAFDDGNMTQNARGKKVFSLFSVVQFPNDQCTSTSSLYPLGTCYAASECEAKSGKSLGNCASGFGVCCVFTTSTCGEQVTQNLTYISNPGHPTDYTVTSDETCTWTVNKVNPDVCQLRLDFDTLVQSVTASGNDQGCCGSGCIINSDSLTITGENVALPPPAICGKNSGQHMYVDLATSSAGTATLDFYSDIGTSITNRQWNIRVTQIECLSKWRAPQGCLQYFMGLKNTISTFNWQGANLLQYQDYTTCVRREEGMCGLMYTESSSSIADSFELPAGTTTPLIASMGDHLCASAWIAIPGGITFKAGGNAVTGDNMYRQCGGTLAVTKSNIPGAAYTKHFDMNVYSTGGASVAHTGAGMALDYSQMPCGFTQVEY